MYLEIVTMKAEMADMLAEAQAAKDAAEAAALASAKYYALFEIANIAADVDTSDWSEHQLEAYEEAIAAAQEAIEAATTTEEIEEAIAALKEALAAIEDDCAAKNFTDVDLNAWYHEAVDYVLMNGLMQGMSDTEFAPNDNMTRAQLVTVLYRLAGAPSVEGLENPFEDVADGQWYTDAVIWAANEGIVTGTSDVTFTPANNVTREQLVTILYRYIGEPEADTAVLETYDDVAEISEYAVDAFAWAVENGVITGMTETTLSPKTTATRAQVATILMRSADIINN